MMDEAMMVPVGGVDQDAVAIVPTGTVTFVLTDVERSTLLWEERGEVMARVMARCHDLLAETIQACGGVLPEEQGEGDSAVAVFVRASDAVACALDLQRALGSEPWPERVDVRVRVALHTGDAVLGDPRGGTSCGMRIYTTTSARFARCRPCPTTCPSSSPASLAARPRSWRF